MRGRPPQNVKRKRITISLRNDLEEFLEKLLYDPVLNRRLQAERNTLIEKALEEYLERNYLGAWRAYKSNQKKLTE